jgi:hypothetical protein
LNGCPAGSAGLNNSIEQTPLSKVFVSFRYQQRKFLPPTELNNIFLLVKICMFYRKSIGHYMCESILLEIRNNSVFLKKGA